MNLEIWRTGGSILCALASHMQPACTGCWLVIAIFGGSPQYELLCDVCYVTTVTRGCVSWLPPRLDQLRGINGKAKHDLSVCR